MIVVTLDEMLHRRRMSLTELADAVGITLANLSILKTGKARAIRFSTLDAICRTRGAPRRVILDDGPELIAKALDAWAYAHGVELAFTRPAKPVDTCYVERFHDKFRDECLSLHWFLEDRAMVDAEQLP